MSYGDEWDDETVDRLLGGVVPARTTITPAIEDELARMTVESGNTVKIADRPRRVKRVAAVGVTLAVLLGGAGAAAAATLGGWSPWAEDPDGKYFYTAPTGELCEVRVGNIYASDPQIEELIKDAQGWDVVLDDEAIAAEYADEERLHQEYEAAQIALGKEPVVQPDEVLYEIAIHRTIEKHVADQLAEQGIDLDDASIGLSRGLSGEILCAEAPSE